MLALAGISAAAVGLVGAKAAHAAGVQPQLRIVALHARSDAGSSVAGAGGSVTVTVRVAHAATCTFLRRFPAAAALVAVATGNCASGYAVTTIVVPRNPHTNPITLAFAVRARGRTGAAVTRQVVLTQKAGGRVGPGGSGGSGGHGGSQRPIASMQVDTSTFSLSGGAATFTFTSTGATTCTLGSNPALWGGANPMSVPCSGTYRATISPSSSARTWTVTFTATNAAGLSDFVDQIVNQQAIAPAATQVPGSAVYSANWAGYAIDGSAVITDVTATWTVPNVSCSDAPERATVAAWVGIGGDSESAGSLLQTGIAAKCLSGQATYYGWWELYPSTPNHSHVFVSFPVSPGDQILADVYQDDAGEWVTRLDDHSTGLVGLAVIGQGWGVEREGASSYTSQGSDSNGYSGGSSAEWIVEDPSDLSGTQEPFPSFDPITFSGLRAGLTSWSISQGSRITMTDDSGAVMAAPSFPLDDGTFTITHGG